MKKIRNIVPLTLGGIVVEPGTVFEYDSYFKEYRVSPHSCIGWVTDAQASDRRLFEPVEERFIRNGEPYHAVTAAGESCDLYFIGGCPKDELRLAFGNVFRVDTKVNPSGVHIDDALKVFRLALRVPQLWEYLRWRLDSKCLTPDNPLSIVQMQAVDEAIQEIKAAVGPQPGDCK